MATGLRWRGAHLFGPLMATSTDPSGSARGQQSPRAARASLEEAMGNLDLTEEEATPLVVDDLEEVVQQK